MPGPRVDQRRQTTVETVEFRQRTVSAGLYAVVVLPHQRQSHFCYLHFIQDCWGVSGGAAATSRGAAAIILALRPR